jgi:hypothetical protein
MTQSGHGLAFVKLGVSRDRYVESTDYNPGTCF